MLLKVNRKMQPFLRSIRWRRKPRVAKQGSAAEPHAAGAELSLRRAGEGACPYTDIAESGSFLSDAVRGVLDQSEYGL